MKLLSILALLLGAFAWVFWPFANDPTPQPAPDPSFAQKEPEQTTPPQQESLRKTAEAEAPLDIGLAQGFLDQLADQYGYEPMPGDDFFGPLHVAERIARENGIVPYPTRYQAIVNSLSSARAAELLDCLQRKYAHIEQGGRFRLDEVLTEPIMLWEPMAKFFCESWLKFDTFELKNAQLEFSLPLIKRHHVETPSINIQRITISSEMNPGGKELTEEQLDLLSSVMDNHKDSILDRIINNGLFEAQLTARTAEVEAGRYEHVPNLAFGTLELCDSTPKGATALRVMHVFEGWAVYLVILHGEYPELDQKLADLQLVVDARNNEIKAFIASF
jgi:hypothetical protein